jgi:hypothetical protein
MIPEHVKPRRTPQLLTVRLWQEEIRPAVWEWRGQVRQVQTGETRYFRTHGQLLALLQELLPPLANSAHGQAPPGL